MVNSSFKDYFSVIADHRQQGKIRHPLISIFFIAVAAAIASCDDWEEVTCWAEEKIDWLKKFIDLPMGIPSESTFQRVFRMINPKQFEKCFAGWAMELAGDLNKNIVSIDGKTLRGAKECAGQKSAVHIVSAYMSEKGLTLGEVKTNEKSNEITAIPELLKLLAIENTVVTIDAAGTHQNIAKQIIKDNKADYVLALKGNQGNMHKDAVLYFTGVDLNAGSEESGAKIREVASTIPTLIASNGNKPNSFAPVFLESEFQSTQTLDKGHGRIERRCYVLTEDISWIYNYDKWAGLKSIGMAISNITNIKTGETSFESRFYLCSINDIVSFSKAVREHWGIESNHWTLDVIFNEDKSRIRKDHEPQNVAMLRRLAINYLKVDKQKDLLDDNLSGRRRRESFKIKRKRAMMRDDYLEKVMVGNFL